MKPILTLKQQVKEVKSCVTNLTTIVLRYM